MVILHIQIIIFKFFVNVKLIQNVQSLIFFQFYRYWKKLMLTALRFIHCLMLTVMKTKTTKNRSSIKLINFFSNKLFKLLSFPKVKQLKEAVPFAVCGANQLLEVRGKKGRGRFYPWGVVEVENPEHCDFIKLRTMLM